MEIEVAKQYLGINKFSLDEEAERQTTLYSDIADAYADAMDKMDTSKALLEELDARIYLEIRSTTTDKLTEARVEAMIQTNAERVRQRDLYLGYKREATKWKGVLESASQKADMIKELVKMHGMSYFGTTVGSALTSRETSAKYKDTLQRMEEKRKEGTV